MTSQSKVCLIGDVVVDITLKTLTTSTKMRLGGITHAARALWALKIPYDIVYFAPSYLDEQVKDYFYNHGCNLVSKAGDVIGSPYLFLIGEAKEIGDQGYEFILRDHIEINYDDDVLNNLSNKKYEDFLLISGNYDQKQIFKRLSGRVHIDVANNVAAMGYFSSLNAKLQTIFISTSSTIFKNEYNGSFKEFTDQFRPFCETIILKENRGGSRGVRFADDQIFIAKAQTQPILHSVGVGDVFDVCYVVKSLSDNPELALTFSSWIASEYAQTTYPDDFKRQVERTSKTEVSDLASIAGVSLPWEKRDQINIYIAAPDFDHIDRTPITQLDSALKYHNFTPRRPVIENGQMEVDASKTRRQQLYFQDMALLEHCQLMIGVLLYNDPGTLIEIGLASAKGIPTLVYDPYKIASNCILTELPTLLSDDLDSIISEVFIQSNLIINGGK